MSEFLFFSPMKSACFLVFFTALSANLFSQNTLTADPFPVYNPFAGEQDSPENSYPFFAPEQSYSYCSLDDEGEPECRRRTVRYAYSPNRSDEDGNSNLDMYYTDYWDSNAAPDGKPLIVLLHGARGARNSTSLSKMAVMFATRGYLAVVPDYTTFRDEKWGDTGNAVDFPCLDEREIKYILQETLRDVRAAIRKTLSISSTSTAQDLFSVNPNQIFLYGVSHGAYTALQLATMDITDFPTGNVTIDGNEYNFAQSLDDLAICPEEGPCQGVAVPAAYDLKGSIAGVSLSMGATLSTDVITDDDQAAMLFFHGTCDAAAPYWELSQKDVIARNITAGIPDFPEEDLPCREAGDGDYPVYGTRRIYDHIAENSDGLRPIGFFSFCGARHNISGRYGLSGDDPDELQAGLIEYETLRFFSQLLNGDQPSSFEYSLDHSLWPISDDSEETLANHCAAVDNYGPSWPDASNKCPTCNQDAAYYANELRAPFFDGSVADEERYPKITEVAAQIEGCPSSSFEDGLEDISDTRIGDQNPDPPVIIIRVFDFTGFPISLSRRSTTLDSFLQSPPEGLSTGIYFIHLSDGTRKAYRLK